MVIRETAKHCTWIAQAAKRIDITGNPPGAGHFRSPPSRMSNPTFACAICHSRIKDKLELRPRAALGNEGGRGKEVRIEFALCVQYAKRFSVESIVERYRSVMPDRICLKSRLLFNEISPCMPAPAGGGVRGDGVSPGRGSLIGVVLANTVMPFEVVAREI